MRDEQTGTYWQQITGRAVSGPLAGRRLTLVSADELTFGLWKKEQPNGTVLNDVRRYTREYAPENWDVKMAKVPTVISYAQAGINPRDLMLGINVFGASRAFPFKTVVKAELLEDRIGSESVMLVVGRDNRSVRVFRQRIAGISETPQFYRIADEKAKAARSDRAQSNALFVDAQTGSEWNFKGCAVSGKLRGVCLDHIDVIKDYWFDWRNYNPHTTVYGIKQKIQ